MKRLARSATYDISEAMRTIIQLPTRRPSPMNLPTYRILRHLAVGAVLLMTIGIIHGLDVAMIVAFSMVVMEIDAYAP